MPHERITTEGHVTRREVVDNRRSIEVLREGIPASAPLSTAHAPQYETLYREIAQGVRPGPDDPADSIQRGKALLKHIQTMREAFVDEGSEEALAIEGALRADRPPEPEPVLSEQERVARALALLEVK